MFEQKGNLGHLLPVQLSGASLGLFSLPGLYHTGQACWVTPQDCPGCLDLKEAPSVPEGVMVFSAVS